MVYSVGAIKKTIDDYLNVANSLRAQGRYTEARRAEAQAELWKQKLKQQNKKSGVVYINGQGYSTAYPEQMKKQLQSRSNKSSIVVVQPEGTPPSETAKAITEAAKEQKKNTTTIVTLKKESSISPEAKKVYESYTPEERGMAHVATGVLSSRGWEYWASAVGIGKKKPEQVVEEEITDIGRTKKNLVPKSVASFFGSPAGVILTSPIGGYGTTSLLAKLGTKAPRVAIGAKLGLTAAGLGLSGSEVYKSYKEYKRGETARSVGRLARLGTAWGGFYLGSKAAQYEITRMRLGRALEQEHTYEIQKGKIWIKSRAKFYPKRGKAGIVDIKREFMIPERYLKGASKGRIEGLGRDQISLKRVMQPKKVRWNEYLKSLAASTKETFTNFKGQEKGSALISPNEGLTKLSVEQTFGDVTIKIPKITPSILPTFVYSYKPSYRTKIKTQPLTKPTLDFGLKQIPKPKQDHTPKTTTRTTSATKTSISPLERIRETFRTRQSITPRSSKVQIKPIIPKIPFGLIGGGGFFFGKRMRKTKRLKAPRKYTPSLIGIHMKKFISKPPKLVSGFGIRFPLKKSKKKKILKFNFRRFFK